jgi:hypothetical protein
MRPRRRLEPPARLIAEIRTERQIRARDLRA